MDNTHTIGALKGFLQDVWSGEMEFEQVTNVMGYNELKFLIDELEQAQADLEIARKQWTAERQDNERLKERNSSLASYCAIYRALNNQYRKALEEIESELRCNADRKQAIRTVGEILEKALEGSSE